MLAMKKESVWHELTTKLSVVLSPDIPPTADKQVGAVMRQAPGLSRLFTLGSANEEGADIYPVLLDLEPAEVETVLSDVGDVDRRLWHTLSELRRSLAVAAQGRDMTRVAVGIRFYVEFSPLQTAVYSLVERPGEVEDGSSSL